MPQAPATVRRTASRNASIDPACRAVCRAIAWITANRFFERCVSSRSSSRKWASPSLRSVTSTAAPLKSDDRAGLVAQRLDMQVVPARCRRTPRSRLRRACGSPLSSTSRLSAVNAAPAAAGKMFSSVRPSDVVDAAAKHRVADRRVAQVAILRVNRDLRAAQRRLVAHAARSLSARKRAFSRRSSLRPPPAWSSSSRCDFCDQHRSPAGPSLDGVNCIISDSTGRLTAPHIRCPRREDLTPPQPHFRCTRAHCQCRRGHAPAQGRRSLTYALSWRGVRVGGRCARRTEPGSARPKPSPAGKAWR